MSSFVGHGLAALTVYAMGPEARPTRWGWLAWLGVLVPLCAGLVLLRHGHARSTRRALLISGLALVSSGFMAWAASLPR